jgi:DNA-binding CsgD family transcriptional regulator
MSFWHRLLHALGFQPPPERVYYLDDDLVQSLQELAEQELRPEDEVAADLITDAFIRRLAFMDLQRRWRSLSPREQQATMLVCQNYTTDEVAAEMMISPNTVKTHVHNSMLKFAVHSRSELRRLLADFDFTSGARRPGR